MHASKDSSNWWCRFLGASSDKNGDAVTILSQRYGEEREGAARFKQHAQSMHYPQFRQTLLRFAAEKTTHAELLAEKISALSGKLPDGAAHRSTDENSWRNLLVDLEEENRIADHLPRQLWTIESRHPDIAELLKRINETEKKYQAQIRDMIMRSDAFAFSLA